MQVKKFRIGQIVPSSNTTMETEIPAILYARQKIHPELFTFHSSRMRMMKVSKEELATMDRESDRCAAELTDARVDVMGYACLVAIMSQGKGYHRDSEARLGDVTDTSGAKIPVVSSAGALVDAIKTMGARKISIVTPYMKPLTNMVVEYIEHEGIEVKDALSLEVQDNLEVGRLDPMNLVNHAQKLDVKGVDLVVLSACVQMPSLQAVPVVEKMLNLPVVTASIATTYQMLKEIGLRAEAPDAGMLLSGKYA